MSNNTTIKNLDGEPIPAHADKAAWYERLESAIAALNTMICTMPADVPKWIADTLVEADYAVNSMHSCINNEPEQSTREWLEAPCTRVYIDRNNPA